MYIINQIETKKGKRCLIIDNYKFSEVNRLKDGSIRFRCTNRKCNANVYVNELLNEVLTVTNFPHSHLEMATDYVKLETIRTAVKRKAEDDLHAKPNKVILKTIEESGLAGDIEHEDIKLLRKSMYAVRRHHYPTLPRDIDETFNQLYTEQSHIVYKGEQFCFVNIEKRIILFTCKDNLRQLCVSKIAFADGTFSYSPSFFTQLYTIHVHTNDFYIPVIYCCLQSKSTQCYLNMWSEIKNLCMSLVGLELHIDCLYMDFECGAHSAARMSFPNIKVLCCAFHLAQSFYRKIQCNKSLLKEYRNKHSEIGNWLKWFYGLAFLPCQEVSEGFADLVSIAPTTDMTFADYVLHTYVEEDSTYPPVLWAAKPSHSPRTTNGPESFHSFYNSQFYHAHPNIYNVIDVLKTFQTLSNTKFNSIKRGRKNIVRKETTEKNNLIKFYWLEYQGGNITRLQYIKKIGMTKQV